MRKKPNACGAILALFEEHRSLLLNLAEIERRGFGTLKSWTRKNGQFRSGRACALNSLRRLD